MASGKDPDEPVEEPGRPFADWWETYRDPSYPIKTVGDLFGKCREAADELLTAVNAKLSGSDRTSAVRVLACLILDAYENNRWDYPADD